VLATVRARRLHDDARTLPPPFAILSAPAYYSRGHSSPGVANVIESIEIKNLRGIRDGKLENLSPLTILVGPNGCGKSTVLDALFLASSFSPNSAARAVCSRHGVLAKWPRWLFWRAEKHGKAVILAKRDGENRLLQGRLGDACTFVALPGAFEPGPVCLVDFADSGHAPPLHQVYTSAVQRGQRQELSEIVAEIIPGATGLEILTEGDEPVLNVVYPDRALPVAFAGDGIHALLRLLFELAACAGGLCLCEEPEAHQHPGAMRQGARAVLAAVRRGIQVVLTTHSLELIDILLAEAKPDDLEKLSLFRLKLQDGALASSRLAGKDVAFARNQIQDDLR
jgi:hypothetical protein